MKKFIAAPFGNYIKTKNTISVSGSWTVEKKNWSNHTNSKDSKIHKTRMGKQNRP